MKKNSLVIGVLAVLGLIFSLGLTQQNTSAKYWKEYYYRPRKVKVIKPVKIYKMKIEHPMMYNHSVGSKTLKEGAIVHIQDCASYEWIVTHKGWANGYFKRGGKYFWQCPIPKGWYKLVK